MNDGPYSSVIRPWCEKLKQRVPVR